MQHLRRRHPGAGPPRGRPLRLRRVPHRRRRAARRGRSRRRRCRPPASSPRCSCRRCPAAGAPGHGRRARPGAVLRRHGRPPARRAVAATTSRSTSTSTSSTAPAAPTSTSRHLRRGHQDHLRHVPALLPVHLGRARRRGGQHQGARLQREGRGPAVPRPPQHRASTDDERDRYGRLGLPAGPFPSVAVFAPPRRGDPSAVPDVASRAERRHLVLLDARGVLPRRAAAVPVRRRRGRPPAVHDGRPQRDPPAWPRRPPARRRRRSAIEGRDVRTFRELVDLIARPGRRGRRPADWAGRAIGSGTVNAFVRRLHGARPPPRAPDPRRRRRTPTATGSDFDRAQVTVVDLHNLHDRAKRFVVGVMLRRAFEEKERAGAARPLLFVVLDELNKYAPREGSQPDQGDPARRGRAGPLARHHPDRRPADRLGGRAADRGQLAPSGSSAGSTRPRPAAAGVRLPARRRSASGPRSSSRARCSSPSPSCRCRSLVQFPFPAWATRPSEAADRLAGPTPRGADGATRTRMARRTAATAPALRRPTRSPDCPASDDASG